MENLLSPHEAAALLNISVRTLYDRRWRRQWSLSAVRVGARALRFKPSEIERFLERQQDGFASDPLRREPKSRMAAKA